MEEEILMNFGGESSRSSFTSDSGDGQQFYKMIEEEERLLLESEKLERMKKKEVEEKLAKERDAEIKEKRYKKLMHLLNNSKMYSVILKNKLHDEESKRKKYNKSDNQIQKRTNNYNIGDIINHETINEKMAETDNTSQTPIEDENYFKETKLTELGFTVSVKQPILLEGTAMRDYQLRGLDWLKVLFMNGVNGILGDEMGLGKTIQVISFICYLIEINIQGPFLIIAPLSTLNNWVSEFKKFAPKVSVIIYCGNAAERANLVPKITEMYNVLNKTVYKVVITSYQIPLNDKYLGKINWYYLIIDEGHRIKNHNSQLSRTLRPYNTIGRLLLTGTPLQNDLWELWSLLNFLLPEVFNSLDVFQSWFDIKELESNETKFLEEKSNMNIVTTLQEILMPFMLRREKKDVNINLPPKKEILIYCPLTPQQKSLYEKILDRSIKNLLNPKEEDVNMNEPLPKRRCFLYSPYGRRNLESQKPKIVENAEEKENERFVFRKTSTLRPQMQLREVANHPYLLQFPLKPGTEECRIDEDLVKSSGKLLVLDSILAKLKSRGHKIMLDILEEHAIMRGYSYCRFDGGTTLEDRGNEIFRFNTDPEVFVLYTTLRSGGLGINLTAADTVVLFDSDWNPQVNLQSQDRCHRMGQLKPVLIYTLCSKGTIDEKIIERGTAKRRLEKMILQKGVFTLNREIPKKLTLMELKELKSLLETTQCNFLSSNGFILSDKELDSLLDRSEMANENASQENGEFFKVIKTDTDE